MGIPWLRGLLSSLLFLSPISISMTHPLDPDYQDSLVDAADGALIAKRFMGIFRCNGWGPGCSHLANGGAGGVGGGGGRGGGGAERVQQMKAVAPTLTEGAPLARIAPQGHEGRGPGISKGQPYFTLTSGESWGPTGKRASTQPSYMRRMLHLMRKLDLLRDFYLPERQQRDMETPTYNNYHF